MKRCVITVLVWAVTSLGAPLAAQQPTVDASTLDPVAVSAWGRDLKSKRDTLENRYKEELKQCYQRFNVTGCRDEARERYVIEHRALTKLELDQAAQQRALDAADARQRLSERQAEAQDRAREAERAQQEAVERANRNASKQTDHIPESSKRGEYEEKQRDAQERRKESERRAREREKPRAAPLPAPGTSQ